MLAETHPGALAPRGTLRPSPFPPRPDPARSVFRLCGRHTLEQGEHFFPGQDLLHSEPPGGLRPRRPETAPSFPLAGEQQ
jgi:hypothetical protein